MNIIKVTSGNKWDFRTPLTNMPAYLVGSFILVDNEGRVRYAGRKRDCVAMQAKIEGK